MKCQFWIKDPKYLLLNPTLIPHESMCVDEKLNVLSRIILLLLLFLYIFDYIPLNIFLTFLLISISIIIIFHSILERENTDMVERFSWTNNEFSWATPATKVGSPSFQKTATAVRKEVKDNSGYDTYVGLEEKIVPNQTYYSSNDALANGDNRYNPNIFIKPLMPPPLASLDEWKTNNFVTHSNINYRARTDLVQSGYLVSNPCGCYPNTIPRVDYGQPSTCGLVENFEQRKKTETIKEADTEEKEDAPQDTSEIMSTPIDGDDKLVDARNSADTGRVSETRINVRTTPITGGYATRGFTVLDRPRFDTDINDPFGYYPNNPKLKSAPVNVPTQESKEFNRKIFTTTLSPYTTMVSDVVQPVNSNLGITYPQPFQPRSYIVEDNDKVTVKRHDPRQYKPEVKPLVIKQDYSNVFDPTSNGYGTSYRGYIEPIVGQPRYYYDDIKNVRKPNMITRNKIDHAPWAEDYGLTYGTATQTGVGLEEVKQMAHDQINQSEMRRRLDLQNSLLRKRADVDWQRKLYPIFTGSSKAVH